MFAQTIGVNPFSTLLLVFLSVIGLSFLYAMTLQLKGGQTGLLRLILALGIVYGFMHELGIKVPAPSSMSIVCSILFSTAWLVETIDHRAHSNRSSVVNSESQ